MTSSLVNYTGHLLALGRASNSCDYMDSQTYEPKWCGQYIGKQSLGRSIRRQANGKTGITKKCMLSGT